MSSAADKLYHLARVWRRKGKFHQAHTHYKKALEIDPQHGLARDDFAGFLTEIAYQHWKEGRTKDALAALDQAEALKPTIERIRSRLSDVRREIGSGSASSPMVPVPRNVSRITLKSNPEGKIDMRGQKHMEGHRSGWAHVLRILEKLHNEEGVLFDGVIENNFAWQHKHEGCRSQQELDQLRLRGSYRWDATSEEQGITPYLKPWVGVIHNPPNMPQWFLYHTSPQVIMEKTIWEKSLQSCIGLFAFSEYFASWLREKTGKPVSALIHPTEFPECNFTYDRFAANRHKKIVQNGWWLRRLNAIYELPIATDNPQGYVKVRMTPLNSQDSHLHFEHLIETERRMEGIELAAEFSNNTVVYPYLTNDDYDQLLSENIVFNHLYDASANNSVIECIVRGTPLLINPLPAVVEYLGPEYPFYYENLEEAARKAMDMDLIRKTHGYLITCDIRPKLSDDYFLESFVRSEVYNLI